MLINAYTIQNGPSNLRKLFPFNETVLGWTIPQHTYHTPSHIPFSWKSGGNQGYHIIQIEICRSAK